MSKWEKEGEIVVKNVNEPPLKDRTPDMLWLDLSSTPNIMKRWDAENKEWVKASHTTAEEVGAETPGGAQDKANKAEDNAIAEAAEDAAIKAQKAEDNAVEKAEEMDEEVKIELKSYVEGLTEEVEAATKEHAEKVAADAELNAKIFTEGYAEKEFHYGDEPPEDTDQLWFDLSTEPNKIRRYDEESKTWVAASPTSPSDIGAASIQETIDEANRAREEAIEKAKEEASQAKKDAVQEAKELDKEIKSEAERLANAAEEAANSHTNDVTQQVEEALKQDSQEKADAAKDGAISEADKRIQAAKKESAQDAQNKANAAQKAAEEAAKKHTDELTAQAEKSAKEHADERAKAAEEASKTFTQSYAQKEIKQQSTAPTDTSLLWLDTSKDPNILKRYDATAKKWVNASPTTAGQIGAETPKGAQDKADAAKQAAINAAATDAKEKADAAQKAATDRANTVEKDVKEFASNAGNITTGTIAAERLYGGTIDAGKANIVNINAGNITTGSIDASKIKVINLDASAITTGTLNAARIGAGTITSDKIHVNGLSADVIKTGTINANVVKVINLNASNIIAGTLDAGKVVVTNLSASVLQSGIIDASKVTVNNLDASKITTGTLSADKVKGGSIDANNVNIVNLKAGNITSGTIDASKIAVTNVNANNITTGTLNAARIAANAITTDKLHVLAKSLVANVSTTGNDSTGWAVAKHATSTIGLRASTNMGDVLVHGFTTAEHDQPTQYNSNYFEVDPNQTYKFSIGMYLPKNPRDASQYFGFNAYDKNQKELPVYFVNPNGTNIDPTERTNPYFWSGKDVSGSWRMMDGYVMSSQGQANECPSGRNVHQNFKMHPATKYLRMRFYSGYYPTVKNAAMEVLWHSPSVTSVDSGMILADKIVTGSLDASKVNVRNLNAGNITSGTMTADRINGGTINATNTNIINLKAGNITSGTIDAAKIAVINLDASKITTGMLNVGGTQIAKGTDFMRKDWKPLRSSIAHSVNENYLILGGTQAKEEFVYLPRFDLNGGGGEKVTLSFEYNVDANYVVLPEIFLLASKQTTEALIDSVNHDYVHVLTGSEKPEDIGGNWKRVTKTFAIQNDIKSAVLRLDHNGSKDGKTSNYRYRRVMLNYGSVALTWSPHTEESIGIGAITADNIRAGAITTNKLTVGDFTNLVPNNAFINGTRDEWDRGTVVGAATAGVPAGAPTQYVRTQTERDTYVGDWFAVKQGDRFYCELTAATSNSGVPVSLGLHYVDKDNNPYWTVFTPRINPTGGKWVTQGGEIHISIANATKAKVFMQVDGTTGSTFGTWYVTNAKIHRKTDANLIVDGSVIASKIAANAVTAEKIIANAVTADKIAANAVTAAKIAANSIDAGKIAAGSITTDKIAAAGITADKITSGVLDANRVQVKNLNASVITAGTMSADRITGGTINATNTNIINLKAQNIASGTINADNVTISNGRVTINKDGVTVTQANFLVKDAKTGLTHSTTPATNLINDHSFELLKADTNGGPWLQHYWKIDRSYVGNGFDGWAVVGDPYMVDLYTAESDQNAKLFGRKSVIVNTANYVWQDIAVKANKKYSVSFHCSLPLGAPAGEAGPPQVQVEYVKDGNVIASEVKNFALPPSPVGTWVRYGFTVTANAGLNGRDNRIRLRFRTNNYWYTLLDGMQAVENDTPVSYDAEDSLWQMSNNRLTPVSMHLRNLIMQGNTRIEGGGLSIAGQNINGVGLEMSQRLRIWGNNPIEVRQSHVEATGYRCIDSRPAGVDRMLWLGWHEQSGTALYAFVNGVWRVAAQL
ncbi:hypothetical protein [Bacillus thuringiensis]|uniref:hypothetical protein n=1 Tax=Bacillus thuringiensis TaxID=1428 RepID=UPI001C3ED4DB|nr:hypothetical protein [Bacillus thuringiensis]